MVNLAGRDGRAGWKLRWKFPTSNMRMITSQVILNKVTMQWSLMILI